VIISISYLPQPDLIDFCKREGIHVVAHQPLGGKPLSVVNPYSNRPGPLLDPQVSELVSPNPSRNYSYRFCLQIASIAAECGKSVAQTLLSWNVLRGVGVVPKTAREDRLAENLSLFKLSNEHFERISLLSSETGSVRYLDPQDYIGFDIFDELEDQPVGGDIA